jgi:hypothetical protein
MKLQITLKLQLIFLFFFLKRKKNIRVFGNFHVFGYDLTEDLSAKN